MSFKIFNVPSNFSSINAYLDEGDLCREAEPLMRWDMEESEKAVILEALRKIPCKERKNVIKQAICLIRDDMQGSERVLILRAVQEIPSEERETIIKQAISLVCKGNDADILEAIQKIPSEEREDVIEQAKFLIQDDMYGYEKAATLEAVQKIPPGRRKDLIKQAMPLVCKFGNADILEAIQKIPSEEREDVIEQAKSLIRDNMYGYEKADILEAVQKIPSDEREGIVKLAIPLLYRGSDAAILGFIQEIPSDDREDVIERAKSLIRTDMFSDDVYGSDEAKQLDAFKYKAGTPRNIAIMRSCWKLQGARPYILEAVQNIPPDDREDVVERARSLICDDMDGCRKAGMLGLIQLIPVAEREDVLNRAKPLIRNDMRAMEKCDILRTIEGIPPDDREDVIEQAKSLIRDDMDGLSTAKIFQMVECISPDDRKDVIERAKPLLSYDMSIKGMSYILEAVQEIRVGEREDFIEGVKSFMYQGIGPKHVYQILTAVRLLPREERNLRLQFALAQIEIDFPNRGLNNKNAYANRVIELLETPLNQVFLAMGQDGAMALAAVAGHTEINVHAGLRDDRVKKALILLRKFQSMDDQEIDLAAQECIKYLEEKDLQKALYVLTGPDNKNDYGPFFKGLILNGVKTSGQEVVGRLWRFIHSLSEEERNIALDSLVGELGKCMSDDSERICDPGKAQHLFLAVLQGRLKGVQIDDSIKIPEISSSSENSGESSMSGASSSIATEQALQLFFGPQKHQTIENLEELLAAAHVFCDENPNVMRQDFIKQIEIYAEQQGME